MWEELRGWSWPAVAFESPQRLPTTLRSLAEADPEREVAVCRELTKMHEEAVRGPASELADRYASARGEVTVVVDASGFATGADDRDLAAYMAEMQRAGARRSPAAAEAARRFRVARDQAYALWDEA